MLKHLACIMDGNRRWAAQQGLLSFLGHKNGFAAVKKVIDFCLQKNIAYLSLYTFSIENLQRPEQERHYLFEILAHEAAQELQEFKAKNVRMRFLGDRELFPQTVSTLCDTVEAETKGNDGLHLNFMLCYGGQQEIVSATRYIAAQVASGQLKEKDITPELFADHLWTAGIPSPDLIIRTGNQHRLSNFLLYQCAYSELYFLDCMWPDIAERNLEDALSYYNRSRKMFGK